jgi:hypothetical protein
MDIIIYAAYGRRGGGGRPQTLTFLKTCMTQLRQTSFLLHRSSLIATLLRKQSFRSDTSSAMHIYICVYAFLQLHAIRINPHHAHHS